MSKKFFKEIKQSYKSVTKNIGRYLSFFIVVLVIQIIIGTLEISFASNLNYTNKYVTDAYTVYVTTETDGIEHEASHQRHLRIDNLKNRTNSWFYNNVNGDISIGQNTSFSYVEYESYTNASGEVIYSAWVSLLDPVEKNASVFINKYVASLEDESITLTYTPLYKLSEYRNVSIFNHIKAMLCAVAFCVAALMLMYSLRVNYFKFQYGIYMSFGADFKKLFFTAFSELGIVSLLTFIPSMIIAYIICVITLNSAGVAVTLSFLTLIIITVLNLFVLLAAVYPPMKAMSKKTPVHLISAQDNSNLVASPRESFRIFNTAFPKKYELFGTLRFRKYYIRLLLGTAAFCAVFVCSFYMSQMSLEDNSADRYSYIVENNYELFDSKDSYNEQLDDISIIINEISSFDTVKYPFIFNAAPASESRSHILINKDNQYSSGHIINSNEVNGFDSAACEYNYTVFTQQMLDILANDNICTFEGDPYLVLDTSSNYIIVSEYINNKKCFDFEPGDRIVIAKYLSGSISDGITALSVIDSLHWQLESFEFAYEEYTICAVADSIADNGMFTVGVNCDDYYEICGAYPSFDVKLYMEEESKAADIIDIRLPLLSSLPGRDKWTLNDSDDFVLGMINKAKCQSVFYRIFGSFMLMVTPIIWIFSQLMFYKKREKEMYILSAFGAFEHEIKKIYIYGGIYVSICSFVLSVIISTLAGTGLYALSNLLVSYGFSSLTGVKNVFYEFGLSFPALIICALVSAFCGFISSYLSYLMYKIKLKETAHEENAS